MYAASNLSCAPISAAIKSAEQIELKNQSGEENCQLEWTPVSETGFY
jgi:hypothetical protein